MEDYHIVRTCALKYYYHYTLNVPTIIFFIIRMVMDAVI